CKIVVPRRYRNKAVDLLQEKCYTILNCKDCGVAGLSYFLTQHIFIAVFSIALVVFLLVSQNLCINTVIDYSGDKQVVSNLLEQYGITKFSRIDNVSYDSLENYLAVALGSEYVTVSRTGSSLFIKVYDRTMAHKPIDYNLRHDVVAMRDGVVTKIIVLRGTAKVNIGDKVEKGQVLIEGTVVHLDGSVADTYAVGEVFASVTVEEIAYHNEVQTIFARTGNTFCYNTVGLFDFKTQRSVPFQRYEIEERVTVIQPFCITITHCCAYETKEGTVKVPFLYAISDLKAKALSLATEKADFKVLSTEFITGKDSVTAILRGNIKISSEE
ncbi:MAG: sporulation protein YqfD, partial [Clostridia bacterium]